jgi:hypothetical protein
MSGAQMAIAAKMLRMNADATASIVQVLEAAQQTLPVSPTLLPASGEISTLQCGVCLTGRRAFMGRLPP